MSMTRTHRIVAEAPLSIHEQLTMSREVHEEDDAVRSRGRLQPVSMTHFGKALLAAGFSKVDYIALVDAHTLEPLDTPSGEMRLRSWTLRILSS